MVPVETRNFLTKVNGRVQYAQEIVDAFDKVFAEAAQTNAESGAETVKSSAKNANTAFSFNTLSDGTEYVKLDGNIFLKSNGTEMTPREAYREITGMSITLSDGDVVTFVDTLPGNKNMYNELIKRWPAFDNGIDIRTLNDEVNRNIIEALTYSSAKRKNVPDVDNKHAKNGITHFDTRTVTVADDNGAYTLDLSIAKLTDGSKVAYAKKNVAIDNATWAKIKKAASRSTSPFKQPSDDSVPQSDAESQETFSPTGGQLQLVDNPDNAAPTANPDVRLMLSDAIDTQSETGYDRKNAPSRNLAWAIESGVVNRQDQGALWNAVNRHARGEYLTEIDDGLYLVERGNKIMITDADRDAPSLEAVYEINSDNSDAIRHFKGVFYDEARFGYSYDEAFRVARIAFGEMLVRSYVQQDFETHGRYDGRREGSVRGADDPGYQEWQNQNLTSGGDPQLMLADYIDEYGEIEPGENPAREVHLPKKTKTTCKRDSTFAGDLF